MKQQKFYGNQHISARERCSQKSLYDNFGFVKSPDIRKQWKDKILANPKNMKVVTSSQQGLTKNSSDSKHLDHYGNNSNNKFTGQAEDKILNLKIQITTLWTFGRI